MLCPCCQIPVRVEVTGCRGYEQYVCMACGYMVRYTLERLMDRGATASVYPYHHATDRQTTQGETI